MIEVSISSLLQIGIVILTTALGVIGWLVRQLWNAVQEHGTRAGESHDDVLDVLVDIREEIQVVRRRVNGHAKRINRNHQLIREAHPDYGTGKGGGIGKGED